MRPVSPAPRWMRAGLALVLGSVAGAITVASAAPWGRGYISALTLLGLLLLGTGTGCRLSAVVGAALCCLGSAFVLGHASSDGVPRMVVLVAPLLFASSELAHWSMDLATPAHDEPGVHLARWIWFLGSVGVTVVLSATLVGAAEVQIEGRVWLAPLAVMAALCLLGLAVVLARREPSA